MKENKNNSNVYLAEAPGNLSSEVATAFVELKKTLIGSTSEHTKRVLLAEVRKLNSRNYSWHDLLSAVKAYKYKDSPTEYTPFLKEEQIMSDLETLLETFSLSILQKKFDELTDIAEEMVIKGTLINAILTVFAPREEKA